MGSKKVLYGRESLLFSLRWRRGPLRVFLVFLGYHILKRMAEEDARKSKGSQKVQNSPLGSFAWGNFREILALMKVRMCV